MGGWAADVRYGLRRLARSPGFSVAAVLCITIGIGANTAVFSFARALLFRESPAQAPERLVRMFIHWNNGPQFASFSWPNLVDMRDRAEAFEAVSAESIRPIQLSTDGSQRTRRRVARDGRLLRDPGGPDAPRPRLRTR